MAVTLPQAIIDQVTSQLGALLIDVRFNSGKWEMRGRTGWEVIKGGSLIASKISEIITDASSGSSSGAGFSGMGGGGSGGSSGGGGGGGGGFGPTSGRSYQDFSKPNPHLGDKGNGYGIQEKYNERYGTHEHATWGGDDVGWQMRDAQGNARNMTQSEERNMKRARSAANQEAEHTAWNKRTGKGWKAVIGNDYTESVLAPLLPYTGAAAVGSIYEGTKSMAHSGKDIVSSIGQGIKAASSGLISAGQSIADSITQGALGSLGQTGSGIGRIAHAGIGGVKDVITGGIGAATSVAKVGGTLVGGAVGIAAGGAGAVVGGMMGLGVGSAPGALVGAAIGVGIGALVAKIISGVADKIGGALGALGEAFGKFGEIAGQVITGLIDVMQDGMKSAMAMSSAVMNMSRGGGYSVGGSYSMINALGAFGMSPQSVSGAFGNQNAMFTAPRTAAWGVQGIQSNGEMDGEKFARSVRARFQDFVGQYGTQMGTAIGRSMLQSLGMDNPDTLRMASMGQKNFDRQLKNSKELNLSPTVMKKWDEDISLLETTIGQFIEWAKVNIGNVFLPMIQAGLEGAIKFAVAHKQDFINAITAGAKFLYVDLPFIIEEGLLGASKALGSFAVGIGHFIDFVMKEVKILYPKLEAVAKDGVGAVAGMTGDRGAAVLKDAGLGAAAGAVVGLAFGGIGAGPGAAVGAYLGGKLGGWYHDAYADPDDMDAADNTYMGKDGKHGPKATPGEAATGWIKTFTDGVEKALSGADDDRKARDKEFTDMAKLWMDKTKNGLDVHVKAEIKVDPTQDMMAKVSAYMALATFRKMDMATG